MKAPLSGFICPTCRARRRQEWQPDDTIKCEPCGEVYAPPPPDEPEHDNGDD